MDDPIIVRRSQAQAWMAVTAVLSEVKPDWASGPECGKENAVLAIRQLAAMAENNLKAIENEILRRRGIHPMQPMDEEDDHDRDDRPGPSDDYGYIDPFEDPFEDA